MTIDEITTLLKLIDSLQKRVRELENQAAWIDDINAISLNTLRQMADDADKEEGLT